MQVFPLASVLRQELAPMLLHMRVVLQLAQVLPPVRALIQLGQVGLQLVRVLHVQVGRLVQVPPPRVSVRLQVLGNLPLQALTRHFLSLVPKAQICN